MAHHRCLRKTNRSLCKAQEKWRRKWSTVVILQCLGFTFRLLLSLLCFSFIFFSSRTPPNLSPCMTIYRKIHLVQGKLAQVSQLLRLEGISSLRRAGCLRMKLSHGPGEPDAGLSEFRSKKFQKNDNFAPFLVAFVSRSDNQTSTLSDPSALRYNWCQTS